MATTTPGGLPIPEDTDPVKNGASAIRALAYALDLSVLDVTASAAGAVGNATWVKMSFNTVNYQKGAALALGGSGVIIPAGPTARYMVTASLSFAGSTSGRRIIGVGDASGSSPSGEQVTAAGTGGLTQTIQFAREMSLAGGVTLGLFGYQDSGATLALPDRRLTVRRLNG